MDPVSAGDNITTRWKYSVPPFIVHEILSTGRYSKLVGRFRRKFLHQVSNPMGFPHRVNYTTLWVSVHALFTPVSCLSTFRGHHGLFHALFVLVKPSW